VELLTALFNYINIASYIPFLFILGVMWVLMYNAHKDPDVSFNIYDCLVDPITKEADTKRIGVVLAILTLTWWFVDEAARGTAGVEDAIAYGGMLGLAEFASIWLKSKYPTSPKE